MVPPSLLVTLEEEPEECPQCPLDEKAPDDIKITCAEYLDARLKVVRAKETDEEEGDTNTDETPEIRLDSTPEIRLDSTPEVRLEQPSPTKTRRQQENTPEISLQVPDSPSSSHSGLSTTLLPSRPYSASYLPSSAFGP